jgi:hypothetical protein
LATTCPLPEAVLVSVTVLPSPRVTTAVYSEAVALTLLSVKWKTTALLNALPSVAAGGVRAPADRVEGPTLKLLVLALVAAPPASVTETAKVWLVNDVL